MSNLQKIFLIIGIILFVIILDFSLSGVIDNYMNRTLEELVTLKEHLKNEDFVKSKQKSEELNNNWFNYENILSCFVEHEELERVSTKITIISENVLNFEYKIALEDVKETESLIEHIKDKNKLKLKNIL